MNVTTLKEFHFDTGSKLQLRLIPFVFDVVKQQEVTDYPTLELSYAEKVITAADPFYIVHQCEYFHLCDYEWALKAFHVRKTQPWPFQVSSVGSSIQEVLDMGSRGIVDYLSIHAMVLGLLYLRSTKLDWIAGEDFKETAEKLARHVYIYVNVTDQYLGLMTEPDLLIAKEVKKIFRK